MADPQDLRIPNVKIDLQDPTGTNRPLFRPIYEAPLLERLHRGTKTKVVVRAVPEKGPNGKPWPEDVHFRTTRFSEEQVRLRKLYGDLYGDGERPGRPYFDEKYGQGRFKGAFLRAAKGFWNHENYVSEAIDEEQISENADEIDAAIQAELDAVDDEGQPIDRDQDFGDIDTSDDDQFDAAYAAADAAEKAETEAVEAKADPLAEDDLTEIKGIGPELADALREQGADTFDAVANMSVKDLEALPGIGPASAKAILDSATEKVLGG